MSEMTAPYAHELRLAGASMARRRDLLGALAQLVRQPLSVEALARVASTQGPAIDALEALSDWLDRDNTLEDIFGPGWFQDAEPIDGDSRPPANQRDQRDSGGESR